MYIYEEKAQNYIKASLLCDGFGVSTTAMASRLVLVCVNLAELMRGSKKVIFVASFT